MLFICSAHAEFDRVKFEAYLKRMTDEEKPATLVIGCGHKNAQHKHQDHWTVDIADFDQASLIAGGTPESFSSWGKQGDKEHWKSLQADDQYDITNTYLPVRYKEKFDVVVLEHVNKVVSYNPICVTNAHYMLKEGGKLFMEIRYAHTFPIYEKIYDKVTEYTSESSDDESLNEDLALDAYLSFEDKGIKSVQECLDLADDKTKSAILEYLNIVNKFSKDYEMKKNKTYQSYMIMALSHLGFKNIISLTDSSKYISPFSHEQTPVIYAEKVKLETSVFRKMRGIVSKYEIKPRVVSSK